MDAANTSWISDSFIISPKIGNEMLFGASILKVEQLLHGKLYRISGADKGAFSFRDVEFYFDKGELFRIFCEKPNPNTDGLIKVGMQVNSVIKKLAKNNIIIKPKDEDSLAIVNSKAVLGVDNGRISWWTNER